MDQTKKNKRVTAHKYKGQNAFFFRVKVLAPEERKIFIFQYKISLETAQAMGQLATLVNQDNSEGNNYE